MAVDTTDDIVSGTVATGLPTVSLTVTVIPDWFFIVQVQFWFITLEHTPVVMFTAGAVGIGYVNLT